MTQSASVRQTFSPRAVTKGDLAAFCRDAAQLLHAGIPLHEGLSTLYQDLPKGQFRQALMALEKLVAEGQPLSQALDSLGCFPAYMVQMVSIGENAGRVDDVLVQLSAYYQRMDAFSQKVRSAIVYPLLLILMMTVVVAVLITTVLPLFSDIMGQFGADLSGAASATLHAGFTLSVCIFVVMLAVLLLLAAGMLLSRHEKGQAFLNRLFASFFLTRKLAAKLATAKFVSALASMLKSGLSPEQAMALAMPVAENPRLLTKLKASQAAVTAGESWGRALEQAGVFSGAGNRLVQIGLKTGTMDDAMESLAVYYEDEVADSLDGVVSVIEPTLVAILAVIIGAVMLCAMLPLISIISSIG